jgi:uncharacterized protein (UPF0335 family)
MELCNKNVGGVQMIYLNALNELLEKIEKETKGKVKVDIRKSDIYYLLENQIDGNEFDKKSLKQVISQINSFDSLDEIFRFMLSKHPELNELKQKTLEQQQKAILPGK